MYVSVFSRVLEVSFCCLKHKCFSSSGIISEVVCSERVPSSSLLTDFVIFCASLQVYREYKRGTETVILPTEDAASCTCWSPPSLFLHQRHSAWAHTAGGQLRTGPSRRGGLASSSLQFRDAPRMSLSQHWLLTSQPQGLTTLFLLFEGVALREEPPWLCTLWGRGEPLLAGLLERRRQMTAQ